MTRKEAKRILYVFRSVILVDASHIEAFDMAMKALEQEPCEDCISRDMALETIKWYEDNDYDYYKRLVESMQRIELVQPTRPKGEWEYVQYDKPTIGNYHCSECRFISNADYHFCPNCGADMRSEDKEEE